MMRTICLILLLSMQVAVAEIPSGLDALKDRVQERWSVMSSHKFSDLYEYETPRYREIFSREMFESRYSSDVLWQDIKVGDIDFNEQDSTALIRVDLFTSSSKRGSSKVKATFYERWLLKSDVWWYGGYVNNL